MSTETLIIEGRLIHVDYDSEPDELPSMYSPGQPGGLCVNSVKFQDGTDATLWIMSIDDESESEAMMWVCRLIDRKLSLRAEDQQGERAAERMRSGRRTW